MTHDPLCPVVNATVPFGPFHDDVPDDCLFCPLIAMVRHDTLDKARHAIEAINPGVLYRVDGYEALAAIDALRGKS